MIVLITDFSTLLVQECDQYILAYNLRSSDFIQAPDAMNAFSYDLMVVFPDVLACFLFDGLGHYCVLYSFFIIAVSRQFSSLRHRGSSVCVYIYGREFECAFVWLLM